MFIVLLISLESITSRAIIGILMTLQFLYAVCIIFIRPYKESKSNFIMIFNEFYFSLFLIVLMILNTQDKWNDLKSKISMWVLASNSMIVFLIVFINSVALLFKYFKEK